MQKEKDGSCIELFLMFQTICTCVLVVLFTEQIPGPEVIKLFSCSTQLSMKFKLLTFTEMEFKV